MKILRDLFERQLEHIYNSELLILNAMAEMSGYVADKKLGDIVLAYGHETGMQVKRLEEIAEILHMTFQLNDGKIILGLLEESRDLYDDFPKGFLRDLAIIAKIQHIEHFQICAYETALLYANTLEIEEVAEKLDETLMESYEADECCSAYAQNLMLNNDSSSDATQCP